MSKILVIAENNGASLAAGTSRAVTCAKGLAGASIDVAVFAPAAQQATIAEAAARLAGVSRVLTVAHDAFGAPRAAVLAPAVVALVSAGGYTHVLASSSTFGKDLLPNVAARLGAPCLSDVMALKDARTAVRPIYAGNAIVTVQVATDVTTLVATVRSASFEAAGVQAAAPIEAANLEFTVPAHTRYVGASGAKSDRPDLQTATKVVSGGRALASAENFQIVQRFADRIGAAVGASRAAVDAGYAPSDLQVGQTGKIIAPQLYVAIGISGAIQHLTGIKDAKTIVAINKDPEAPIFEVADYGLVGDLFKLLPEIESLLG